MRVLAWFYMSNNGQWTHGAFSDDLCVYVCVCVCDVREREKYTSGTQRIGQILRLNPVRSQLSTLLKDYKDAQNGTCFVYMWLQSRRCVPIGIFLQGKSSSRNRLFRGVCKPQFFRVQLQRLSGIVPRPPSVPPSDLRSWGLGWGGGGNSCLCPPQIFVGSRSGGRGVNSIFKFLCSPYFSRKGSFRFGDCYRRVPLQKGSHEWFQRFRS